MDTIFKYPLPVSGATQVDLPVGAQVLHVDHQGDAGLLFLWAIVNPDATRTEPRVFEVYGTGHPMAEAPRRHLRTVMAPGALVWHVFERETSE